MGTCWVSWGRGSEEEKTAERPLWPCILAQLPPSEVESLPRGTASLPQPTRGPGPELSGAQGHGASAVPSVTGDLGKLTSFQEIISSLVKRGPGSPAARVVVEIAAGSVGGKHLDLTRVLQKKDAASPSASLVCGKWDQMVTDGRTNLPYWLGPSYDYTWALSPLQKRGDAPHSSLSPAPIAYPRPRPTLASVSEVLGI